MLKVWAVLCVFWIQLNVHTAVFVFRHYFMSHLLLASYTVKIKKPKGRGQ